MLRGWEGLGGGWPCLPGLLREAAAASAPEWEGARAGGAGWGGCGAVPAPTTGISFRFSMGFMFPRVARSQVWFTARPGVRRSRDPSTMPKELPFPKLH